MLWKKDKTDNVNSVEEQNTNTTTQYSIGNNYSCEPDKIIQTPIVLRTVPASSAEQGGKKAKKKRGAGRAVALAVCFCVLLSGIFGVGGGYLTAKYMLANNAPQSTNDGAGTGASNISSNGGAVGYQSIITTANPGMDADASSSAIANVAAAVADSVVEITTEVVTTGTFIGQYVAEGAGSGVILTSDGYIITNNHVIDGATNIIVRTTDGTEHPATLIGTDAQTDIAVIKVEATGLTAAVLGDSDKLVVGEPTVVIGNPLGSLGGTVTNGIVSALNRTITIDGQKMTLLQTNAAVNPGNSGGGMFDINGNLIGIINAKSAGDDVEGLGFAIPINIARDIADQLINFGYIKGRPQLGIQIASIETSSDFWKYRSTELAEYITDYGVYITSWQEGDEFEFGDRIIGFNGASVTTFAALKSEIANCKVGDVVKVTVSRRNRIVEVEVTLIESTPAPAEESENQ